MKEGPDIALIGALVGDPARANMLAALMSGKALTASEIASEGGVAAPTASAHLARLEDGGLVRRRKQGRHSYFALADGEVAALLEAMMGLAARRGHMRVRTGPNDPAMRRARVCYDHLAGEFGVQMLDSMSARGLVSAEAETLSLTPAGRSFAAEFGVDLDEIERGRRPLCRSCLDWSARRAHLAGGLGAAMLGRFYALGWAKRQEGGRVVRFSDAGERAFRAAFPD
ncbi:MAG: metalloregulator ArsR/SmtB family transcription factor [Alphaproteobacteria bacterium]